MFWKANEVHYISFNAPYKISDRTCIRSGATGLLCCDLYQVTLAPPKRKAAIRINLNDVQKEIVFHPNKPGSVLFQSSWNIHIARRKRTIRTGIASRVMFMLYFCFLSNDLAHPPPEGSEERADCRRSGAAPCWAVVCRF